MFLRCRASAEKKATVPQTRRARTSAVAAASKNRRGHRQRRGNLDAEGVSTDHARGIAPNRKIMGIRPRTGTQTTKIPLECPTSERSKEAVERMKQTMHPPAQQRTCSESKSSGNCAVLHTRKKKNKTHQLGRGHTTPHRTAQPQNAMLCDATSSRDSPSKKLWRQGTAVVMMNSTSSFCHRLLPGNVMQKCVVYDRHTQVRSRRRKQTSAL